MINVVIAMLGH